MLDPDACRRFLGRLEVAAERLGGRRLWQVNSIEQGGGVAEMLPSCSATWLAPASMPAGWYSSGSHHHLAVSDAPQSHCPHAFWAAAQNPAGCPPALLHARETMAWNGRWQRA